MNALLLTLALSVAPAAPPAKGACGVAGCPCGCNEGKPCTCGHAATGGLTWTFGGKAKTKRRTASRGRPLRWSFVSAAKGKRARRPARRAFPAAQPPPRMFLPAMGGFGGGMPMMGGGGFGGGGGGCAGGS